MFLEELRGRGYNPKVVLECESPESLKMAVKQRLGIGILYDEIVKEDIHKGIFKAVSIPGLSHKATSYLIYHRERPLSPSAEAFLTLLRSWCADRKNFRHALGRSRVHHNAAVAGRE